MRDVDDTVADRVENLECTDDGTRGSTSTFNRPPDMALTRTA